MSEADRLKPPGAGHEEMPRCCPSLNGVASVPRTGESSTLIRRDMADRRHDCLTPFGGRLKGASEPYIRRAVKTEWCTRRTRRWVPLAHDPDIRNNENVR